MTEHTKGERITFSMQFMLSGSAINPQYAMLSFYPPDGPTFLYEYTPTGSSLNHPATGTFYKDVFVTPPGQWWYRWYGSGTVFGVDEDFFTVNLSAF